MNNVKITLSVEQLREAGACNEGIECFKKLFGEETEIIWNPMNELLVRKDPELKKFFKWLLENKLISSFSFYGMQLNYAHLYNANLNDANLSDANLSDADLRNAYLSNTNLHHANLSNADLRNTNLHHANLSDANLSNAYLSNTNLRNAYLSNTNLRNTNLRNTNLRNAIYNKYTIFPENFEIPKTMFLVA